jgi:hypothetical protein
MQFLSASRRAIDLKDFKRGAREEDCDTLISETTTVVESGRIVAVYYSGLKDPAIDQIRAALPQVKTVKDIRTSGLVTNSRIFGFAPRNELRKHPCRAASFAAEQPRQHAVIAAGAEVVAKYYEASMPEIASEHRALTEGNVKAEFRLGSSMFTSGIVNRNNPLQYHFDSGNFNNCCSAMLGFKSDIGGGQLCVPELNIRFEIADRSLLLFDGQGLLHGVTPIELQAPNAMRFTVVYYALRQMWNCEHITDELIRQRSKRSEIERAVRLNEQVIRPIHRKLKKGKKNDS